MRSARYILLALLASLIVMSCNNVGCTDNQNSIPLAGFYSSSTLRSISVDSIQIGGVGAPGDSLINSSMRPISQVYLPLRSTAESTTFRFHYSRFDWMGIDVSDYVSFDYDTEPYLVSEECGAMFRYRIRKCSYTRQLIDSIAIVDSLITNTDVQRIKIFFRTE